MNNRLSLWHNVIPPIYPRFMLILNSFNPQELLRTLTFVNRASEPSTAQRTIMIFISSPNDTQSCSIVVTISLINDNAPVVDLSGPLIPSVNHSVLLNFSFLVGPASEWISTRDASVSDQDQNSRIESLVAELLPGQLGDRIYLSETVGCSDDGSSVCQLK